MHFHPNHNFVNWGKNISCKQRWYQPETEEEIRQLIEKNEKIRLIGSGHSWSGLCVTHGACVNLDHYNRILNVDLERHQVRAQAGVKMWQLNKELTRYGLALENQGSIDQQSIAGAISTGTHGTGLNFQILGSQLVELTLLKANGEKLIIHKDKDRELYEAAIVNLGALGAIVEVVIQVMPAFCIQDYTTTVSFRELIHDLDFFIENSDHFKMWWLPPSDDIVIYNYKRTQEPANDSRFRRYLKDEMFSVAVYRALVSGGKRFPKMVRHFNRFLTSQMRGPLHRIEESSKVFIVPEPPVHLETEWAFDVRRAKEILTTYRRVLCRTEVFNLSFIQEFRFTKADRFWLSGAHQRDTMWIGLYAYKHENWDSCLEVFEELSKQFEGRPHWGKLFTVQSDYLRKRYLKYDDFVALRKELDPEGKFANPFIENLFG